MPFTSCHEVELKLLCDDITNLYLLNLEIQSGKGIESQISISISLQPDGVKL